MEPTRGVWSQPELIVIARAGPEETVLNACKRSTGGGAEGPAADREACAKWDGGGNCLICGDIGAASPATRQFRALGPPGVPVP